MKLWKGPQKGMPRKIGGVSFFVTPPRDHSSPRLFPVLRAHEAMSLSQVSPIEDEQVERSSVATQVDTPTPGPGPDEDSIWPEEEYKNTAEFCWGCRNQRPGQMEHACLGFGPFLIDEDCDC